MNVVLLSGGIDSTVTLAYVINNYGNVDTKAVWVNYGQRLANAERQAVVEIAKVYGITLEKVAIIPPLGRGSLIDDKVDIPHGSYDDVDVIESGLYVPGRNAFLLMIGVNRAWPKGIVFCGIHAADTPYADQSASFFNFINQAVKVGTYNKISLAAPLLFETKDKIIKIGKELDVPFHLTYSCYEGGRLHCGVCPSCVARREAFRKAGVKDPTEYVV